MYQFNKNKFIWQQDQIIKNGYWTGYSSYRQTGIIWPRHTCFNDVYSNFCYEFALSPTPFAQSLCLGRCFYSQTLDFYRILKRIDFSGFINKMYIVYMISLCFTLSRMRIPTFSTLYFQKKRTSERVSDLFVCFLSFFHNSSLNCLDKNKTITEYNNIHMWNVNMRNGLSCKTFQNIISAMHVRASSMRCACVCVSNNAQFNHHTQQQKQIDEKDEKRQTIRRCSLNSMRGTSICSSPICEYATRWVGTSSIRRTEWRKSSFHYTHICKGKAFNYETERSRKSAMEKTKYEKKDSSLFLLFY